MEERHSRDDDTRPTATTLDDVDPPAWPAPAADATALIRRVHALRAVPLANLTAEDLRLLISQDVARPTLVPLALEVLHRDPLIEGAHYPGDLLQAVLCVPDVHWRAHPGQLLALRECLSRLDRNDPRYPTLGDDELESAVERFTTT